MKGKSIVMLVVALGCGLVAMLGVQQVLSGNNKGEVAKTGQVLVAVQEISAGVPIEDSMVTFKEMPLEMISADSVTEPEDYADRSLRVKAYAGMPVLRTMLGEPGEHGVSNDIPLGMRIQSISVNATSAVSGFVNPGDRVDVQVTYKKRTIDGRSVTRTKTVLEAIEVFAADKNREMQDEDSEGIYKNVSVIVTPNQGNILRLAEKMGELHLSLRHPDDDGSETATDFTSDQLDGQDALFGNDTAPADGEDLLASRADAIRDQIKRDTETESPQTEIVEEAEEPKEPSTWKILVYAGDEVTTFEIPLEEEKAETETDTDESKTETEQEEQPAAS